MNRPTRLLVAALASLALLAAACGDDDETATPAPAEPAPAPTTDPPPPEPQPDPPPPAEPAPEPPPAEPEPPPPAEPEPVAEPAGLSLAEARVEEFRKDVSTIGIDEPVPAPEGLEIFYVQCSVPVCESIRQGIAAAAEAIGANLTSQVHMDTPDTVQATFQAALQAGPDIVMASGNPREWFEDELAEMNESGIPLVAWSLPEGYQPEGITANLITGGDYYFNGVLMADYVTAETGGDANVLFLNIPQFPVLGLEQQGFEAEFAAVCPDCGLRTFEITVEQLIAGEHISTAISELQKDPGINFIVTGFGDMLIGMPESLADAGVGEGVRAISQAGTTFNYGFIADGQLQVADVGLPTGYLGWRAVDAGLRALAGQDVGAFPQRPLTDNVDAADVLVAGIPFRLLEADSVGDPTTAWPGVEGHEEEFKALWGVG